MNKILAYLKKNWLAVALFAIIVGAVFVRTYKFDQYLYFKMDQSRDAILLTNAVNNGPQYLPLLGARVGAVKLKHGFLRLGPISYYFQYLSGVVFHSTQAYVYAYPDLMFSILTIPLLFLFVRLYFSKRNSLLITAMYAFSFIIIQYSRFAWNPNSLQFFLLLTFYGLLKFFNEENEKLRRRWLAVWALAMTIGSQLHFFGFFSLLGISGLMIIFHYELWKKQNVLNHLKKDALKGFAKYAAIVLVIFMVFYTPVIISDVFKGGENTHNFFEALTSKAVNKPLNQKIVKTASENLKYYCLITTSQCYGSDMKKEYPAIAVTGLILLSGMFLVIYNLRKKVLSNIKKDFLILLAVWVAVFTILTVPVSFQLRPRFFIVVFAIPFIAMGLIFEYLEEKLNRRNAILLAILLTAGVVGWNTHGTLAWFKEQADSQKKAIIVKRTLILKAKDGVTLGQLQGAADWMYARHKQGDTLYFYVKPEHVRPIEFLLNNKNDKNLVSATITMNTDPKAQYFAVTPTKSGIEPVTTKYGNDVKIIDSKQFGQLMVYEIDFPSRVTSDTFKFKKAKDSEDRIYWKDVFGIKSTKIK